MFSFFRPPPLAHPPSSPSGSHRPSPSRYRIHQSSWSTFHLVLVDRGKRLLSQTPRVTPPTPTLAQLLSLIMNASNHRPNRPDGPYPARWACTVCPKANNVGRRLTCEQCGSLANYTGTDRERIRQIESLVQFDVHLRQWISTHLSDSDFFVRLRDKLQERRQREWFVSRDHRNSRASSFSSEPEEEPPLLVKPDAHPPKERQRTSSGSGMNSILAQHIMASRARWQCPMCEKFMLAKHTYCRQCHYRRDLTLESSKLPTRLRRTVQACRRCQGKVYDGQNLCRQCVEKKKSRVKSKVKRKVSLETSQTQSPPVDVIELPESEKKESEAESGTSGGQSDIEEIGVNLPGNRNRGTVEIVYLSEPPSSPPPDPNEITFLEEEVVDLLGDEVSIE